MPDENNTQITNPAAAAAPSTNTPAPNTPVDNSSDSSNGSIPEPIERKVEAASIPNDVTNRIKEAHNVLIALSSDPSVDEMAAAIGLSIFLSKLDKHATAIYSGSTPNALEFLKPEKTFEPNVDSLQDFVIALNKEKADHLRYKLDGDFVKIYITPYRTRIAENDLDFSYGDYNVDLVIALDVANGVDLDSALREHGRIMHDASIINITTGNPGKLGEIEWSDKNASSVSEMIAKLLYEMNNNAKLEKEEATAFLTGIVAATNRFSNAKTTPETMQISSFLMDSGANQQLVSKNITPEVENERASLEESHEDETKKAISEEKNEEKETEKNKEDPTKLDIKHTNSEDNLMEDDEKLAESKEANDETKEKKSETPDDSEKIDNNDEKSLLDDLKETETSLSKAALGTIPDKNDEPIKITNEEKLDILPTVDVPTSDSSSEEGIISAPEKVVTPPPSSDLSIGSANEADTEKYGHMLEEALHDINENPAVAGAPSVPANPEINGVPEINYMPMPGEEVLPPPPTPPIDMNTPAPENSTPEVTSAPAVSSQSEPVTPIAPAAPVSAPNPEPLGPQPAMQDQVYAPQANDPNSFKIPGM